MHKVIVTGLFLMVLFNACITSMTPSQFTDQFPHQTASTYYNQVNGNEALANGQCVLLVEDRKYNTPLGITFNDDMAHGATGVDEWVKIDGGNAYILKNYEWVYVQYDGETASQLVVYFDTMQCD